MDQTLNTFSNLLRHDLTISVGEQQQRAADALPDVVSHSNLSWLSQPHLPNGTVEKLVVGVAVWSRYDLTLLDELNHFAESNLNTRVYVFDVDRIGGAFDQLIPGIGEVLQTPVVGHWVGGMLTAKGTGHTGREIVRKVIATTHTPASSA